ncbi:hypothetical protein [Nocardioides bruguierae]|uniref:Uncharacterized protein n=1 Tax=Nocardioides bruguierae TaxID=2945102 RepID=A0A9X2IEL9_9ACTN|nr:hypothetical protein [Nocardioides bruguierae]MCM0618745.1 hypothetical protein [Nocardioides bruguierae]
MNKVTDRRPGLLVAAMANPDLSNAERVLVLVVLHLPAEYVDGIRRPGSAGIDVRGNFSLHYDYLARALHTSPSNAKKLMQRLEAKGVLSKRSTGTFGRPACFQMLLVRGDKTYPVRARNLVPPYGPEDPTSRGDTMSPLTYREPTQPRRAPTSEAEAVADGEAGWVPRSAASSAEVGTTADRHEGSNDGDESSSLPLPPVTRCQWHSWPHLCPSDCANFTPASRRTA